MTPIRRLTLERLEVGYGKKVVAGPVDATFDGGRLCLIKGPNGSGKTTLLRTALGLLPPIRGRVSAEGLASRSYVPQLRRFDEAIPVTVGEVVAMGVPRGASRRERGEATGRALGQVDLGQRRRSAFHDLSGGQRQRALLARALAADADIVALDEPTAGVDRRSTAELWGLLEELAGAGRIVLCVTHDVYDAAALGGRVLTLDGDGLRDA